MNNPEYTTLRLTRIRTGRELSPLVSIAEATVDDYPPLNAMTDEPASLLLSYIHESVEVWSEITPHDKIRSEKQITDQLSILDELGLHTYAAIYNKPMTSASGPWEMKVLVTFINRLDAEEAVTTVNIIA